MNREEKLLESIGEIEDSLIMEAQKEGKLKEKRKPVSRGRILRYAALPAACILLAVTAAEMLGSGVWSLPRYGEESELQEGTGTLAESEASLAAEPAALGEEAEAAAPEGGAEPAEAAVPAEDAEAQAKAAAPQTREAASVSISEIAVLLGMKDADTAPLFGGGEENWSADGAFYLGRHYAFTLEGQAVTMDTSCDENKTVTMLSVWISDGEREVEEEEVRHWLTLLTDYTGTEAVYDGDSSEVGSRNWTWDLGDRVVTLSLLENILTVSMYLPA